MQRYLYILNMKIISTEFWLILAPQLPVPEDKLRRAHSYPEQLGYTFWMIAFLCSLVYNKIGALVHAIIEWQPDI